jgi:hypothetical protein
VDLQNKYQRPSITSLLSAMSFTTIFVALATLAASIAASPVAYPEPKPTTAVCRLCIVSA